MKISIVIPVYNSEKTLKPLIDRIVKCITAISIVQDYEIILVNDNSKDSTFIVAMDVVENYTNVVLIDFGKNFGQHAALMAGFKEVKGDYVICMDDDLQNPPEEMIKLIHKIIDAKLDVVMGSYVQKKHAGLRNIGSKINNYMAEIMIDKPKHLHFTSFFIARRYVINEVLNYSGPYPYIHGIILKITSNIENIIIEHHQREIGKSNYNLKKLFKLWSDGFLNFSVKPLRIASMAGFALSALSFFAIIVLIIQKILSPDIQVGWTSVMVSVVFLGGVQLLCMGLLGEYIGRIYISLNNTPQYTVRNIFRS